MSKTRTKKPATIEVKALRRGEYPSGRQRDAGETFDYTLTESDLESKSLPSWLEGEKFTTRDKPAKLSGVEA